MRGPCNVSVFTLGVLQHSRRETPMSVLIPGSDHSRIAAMLADIAKKRASIAIIPKSSGVSSRARVIPITICGPCETVRSITNHFRAWFIFVLNSLT